MLKESSPLYPQITTKAASPGSVNVYAALGAFPSLREWVGDRVVKSLSVSSYTKPGIWPGRISSITLKCSTTGPGATVTSAASVRRPSNRPRREDRKCLLLWGQSTVNGTINKSVVILFIILL
ncbi:hypothetical protein AII01_24470 [Salmonella enterica]|nr:hypothetical protein [Salmonella enterica]